jgi:tetratricopeptide (TPR) repeat protein
VDRKRLLTRVLGARERAGDDDRVARVLRELADANRLLDLYEEGIQQSKEALEICERLGDAEGQGKCWNCLGWLLFEDGQLDAAEEAASMRSISFGTNIENIGSAISSSSW